MKVVYTGESAPDTITKSIFLAGPTPRNPDEQESWRPDALKILEDKGFDGVVFVPEDRNGEFKMEYDDQVGWEETHLNMADIVLFWVPRDLTLDSTGYPKMAAFTTNVEFGFWADTGKVVFGAPHKAPKNGYLKHYCEKFKIPMADTLTETLELAMEKLGDGAERSDGEREVPLQVWNTESFQSWYKSQKSAHPLNRLDHARVLYTFRPGFKDFVFMWILKVDMWIGAEQRSKSNEFVLARTDISSVLMYHIPKGYETFLDYEVVTVAEYRSPVNNGTSFVLELPSGSSPKKHENPKETAAHEVEEETGFALDPKRIQSHGARQLAATLSSHKSHLFVSELNEEEIEYFKSQDGKVHGNVEDTEQCYIRVKSVWELISEGQMDWSNLGMILSALER